ncbi:hypothetical protein [Sphingopyxis sp. H115]|uniref:hypothetical protein n=1 Tax=Sphingopyxis sp. H115 TaxID=1759073 RepID=UPI000736D867|nr:hypothetical protein [Sphingopyxis sp. H115]KTE17405.1 hypothetical protein ATE71_02490 [Sphingopyxis sp. H115]
MNLTDGLFLIVCVLVGAAPGFVALRFTNGKRSLLVVLSWFLLSAALLWSVGLGPHGFILFAFMPFWFGCFVSFMATLFRLHSETNALLDRKQN